MPAIRWKANWFILAGLVICGVLVYMFTIIPPFKFKSTKRNGENAGLGKNMYSVWPEFTTEPSVSSVFFKQRCAEILSYSMSNLVSVKEQWSNSQDSSCRDLYEKFESIFTFESRSAPLKLPAPFREKVNHWLGEREDLLRQVYNQEVIHVVSEYTREHTIFNSLRDKRPVLPPAKPEDIYVNDLLDETAQNCDFCNFRQNTAEHVFGREESLHSFTASNVFKMDTLHALVAPKKHDPLHWSLEPFLDLFGLVQKWLRKAHHHYPDARFPSLIWDVLPKCGASQVHPHLHVMLDPKRYHGEIEAWRAGASQYYKDHNRNYFTDLVDIYSALNLTVTYGSAVAFASLVPKRDHEVVIISKYADVDFHTLLFMVLRAFIDSFGVKCFSMGMGMPALVGEEGRIPAYARIITRGYVTDIRTDMSSFELFMAASVNIDPYKTMQTIGQYIEELDTYHFPQIKRSAQRRMRW